MKVALVSTAVLKYSQYFVLDAAHWVRVAERAKREGVSASDAEGMQRIQMLYTALYLGARRKPLGLLIEQAEAFDRSAK